MLSELSRPNQPQADDGIAQNHRLRTFHRKLASVLQCNEPFSVEKMTIFHGFFPRFQVFAAIVTYIMILFQFRDFEK